MAQADAEEEIFVLDVPPPDLATVPSSASLLLGSGAASSQPQQQQAMAANPQETAAQQQSDPSSKEERRRDRMLDAMAGTSSTSYRTVRHAGGEECGSSVGASSTGSSKRSHRSSRSGRSHRRRVSLGEKAVGPGAEEAEEDERSTTTRSTRSGRDPMSRGSNRHRSSSSHASHGGGSHPDLLDLGQTHTISASTSAEEKDDDHDNHHDDHDDGGGDEAPGSDPRFRISSEHGIAAQDIIDMSNRGEVLDDVQIASSDAAAGPPRESLEDAGGRETTEKKRRKHHRSKRDHGKSHHKRGSKRGHSRGDGSKSNEYNTLALDDDTASIAEKLQFGWGRNDINSGSAATNVPTPQMIAGVGLEMADLPASHHGRQRASLGSAALGSSIRNLGQSIARGARRISDFDVKYGNLTSAQRWSIGLAADGQHGNLGGGGGGSSDNGSSSQGRSPTSDVDDIAERYMFSPSAAMDYDTAREEITAKRKRREARLREENDKAVGGGGAGFFVGEQGERARWEEHGHGDEDDGYDEEESRFRNVNANAAPPGKVFHRGGASSPLSYGFQDEIEIHEEGYTDDEHGGGGWQSRGGKHGGGGYYVPTFKLFLARSKQKLAASNKVQSNKRPRSRFDDGILDGDLTVDDTDLNDHIRRHDIDMDLVEWTNIGERRKKRRCIFWSVTVAILAVTVTIAAIIMATGSRGSRTQPVQGSDSGSDGSSTGADNAKPGEDGTPVFNGPTDSGWHDGTESGGARSPDPARPMPPGPAPVQPPTSASPPVEFGPLGICTGEDGLCLQCEGDCDNDDECGEGLLCFQRRGSEPVPGCFGVLAVDKKDYCYEPAEDTGPGTLGGQHDYTTQDVMGMLRQITPESVLTDPTTPQYAAMQWVVDDLDQSILYVTESGTEDRLIHRYALAVLYHATGGTSGQWTKDDLWLTPASECGWYGVRCGSEGFDEDETRMRDRRDDDMAGNATLPYDALDEYFIDGDDDKEDMVTYLDLSSNGLVGTIPDEIGSMMSLRQLYLWSNSIGGPIPESLTALTELHTLYLDQNKLTGSIPTAIGSMTSLENFDVSDNSLSSTIPNAFGNLQNLVDLRLSNNELSGEFPLEIADLDKLTTVLMDRNKIEGTLPDLMGMQLRNLMILRLQGNELFGTIPTFESLLLEELHLDDNAFAGPVPVTKSFLLRELYLGKNMLTGEIPDIAPSVDVLQLSFNRLTGTVPASLANLDSAKKILLNGNSLTGSAEFVCEELAALDVFWVDLSDVTCSCCECCT